MKLTRREQWIAGALILAWALSPLLWFWLARPSAQEHTGIVVVVGLLVTGALAVVLLRGRPEELLAARDREMSPLGLTRRTVTEADAVRLIPPQYARSGAWLDGIHAPGTPAGAREVYARDSAGFTFWIYALNQGGTTHSVGNAKVSTTNGQTCACLEFSSREFPEFTLARASVLDRIEEAFGAGDINFEDDPTFSTTWTLRGPDEVAIRGCFTAPVRVVCNWPKEIRVAARGRWLFVYSGDRVLLDDGTRAWVEEAGGIASRLIAALDRSDD